jgi:hypothetical protein
VHRRGEPVYSASLRLQSVLLWNGKPMLLSAIFQLSLKKRKYAVSVISATRRPMRTQDGPRAWRSQRYCLCCAMNTGSPELTRGIFFSTSYS